MIVERADAEEPNMGLTNWKNAPSGPVRKGDVSIAKNYLNRDELDTSNRIVSAYLELAELQAMSHKPMHMANWIDKLDEFVRISSRELLTHAGKISHEEAKTKAEGEYEKYHIKQSSLPQPVDQHFAEAIEEVKRIDKQTKTPSRKKKKP